MEGKVIEKEPLISEEILNDIYKQISELTGLDTRLFNIICRLNYNPPPADVSKAVPASEFHTFADKMNDLLSINSKIISQIRMSINELEKF
jgi:hypothetical protein